MALVHNGFSTYKPFAVSRAVARLSAVLAEAVKRVSVKSGRLTSTDGLRGSERRLDWQQSASGPLPGSVFDARYEGLTAHAARLDAAICHHKRLRY